MTRSMTLAALALVFGLGLPSSTFGQGSQAKPAQEQKQEDPKAAAYDKAIKDLKKADGPFPLYERKKELLLELPESKLGKIFLVQTTLASGLDSGLMHAGMPIGSNPVDAFRFDRNEDQVWLVRPNISTRWKKDDPFAIGAERQFQEAILGSFKIEQQHPEKKLLLVNVTNLFNGDVFRLSEMVAQTLGGPYMLDREKSGPEKVKGFSENTVVQMKLHYFSPRGGGQSSLAALLGLSAPLTLEDDRSAPLRVTYSVWFRKEDDGYVPRVADPRVGYFTENFFTVDRYLNSDRTERFINRFRLEKKDPTAEVSEPVKPIVFTIDPSIPEAYRGAVKEGVLRWNKAFNALGYKNAIQVQDAPKDPDYDHSDGRYNVIRMMVSPSSFFGAISLFRTDPFTGEILNAAITLDGNMIRDLQEEHLRNMSSAQGGRRMYDVLMRDPQRKVPDDYYLFATREEKALDEHVEKLRGLGFGRDLCTYAMSATNSALMSWYAVQAAPMQISKEEYVKRFLSECVSHEVGHALGLRHNFAGSTYLSTDEMADDKATSEHGVSGSVMDYTPANVQAVLRGKGNFFSPVIGPYDMWAVKYGYKSFGAKTPLAERYELSQIASESGKRGHAFMTDEDADGFNPFAVRFDGASDPLNFSAKTILAMKRARDYAILNLPKRGESYSKRTNVVLNTIMRSFKEGRNAARFVGGLASSRHFKGDVGERPTLAPVDPKLQRQAVKLIADHFLSAGSFKLPESVLNSMSTDENQGSWTAPIRDFIGFNQQNLLALLLSASTTDRIAENVYKSKVAYGLDEHYTILVGAVFSEIGADKNVEPLRRDLQRFTLNGLITIAGAPAGSVNEDSRLMASSSLRKLHARMQDQLKRGEKLDNMTRLHLKDASETVQRFLNRSVSTSR